MTGQEIINAAFAEIGVADPGETPNSSDSTLALGVLNRMAESWSTERLYIYHTPLTTVTLSSGTLSYSLSTRPVKIEAANVMYTAPGGEIVRHPLKQVSAAEWASIPFREIVSATMQDGVVYCDFGYPTATLYVAPKPTGATTKYVELRTWEQLAQFANLSTDNDYPPGYDRALVLGLAVELADSFSRPVTQQLMARHDKALAAIRALNGSIAANPSVAPPAGPTSALPA